MKKNLIVILILSINFCIYGQNIADTSYKKKIIEQFKINIIGEWYAYGTPIVFKTLDSFGYESVEDSVLKKIPTYHSNKIEFYKNGFIRIDSSSSLKPYEIIGIKDLKTSHSITVKIEGFNCTASIEKDNLHLYYHSETYTFIQFLSREK